MTQVAAALKVKPGLVVVKKLVAKYGGGTGEFVAYAYADEKALALVEPEYMRKRNAAPEKPAASEEAPAAENEKPVDEKVVEATEDSDKKGEQKKKDEPSPEKKAEAPAEKE